MCGLAAPSILPGECSGALLSGCTSLLLPRGTTETSQTCLLGYLLLPNLNARATVVIRKDSRSAYKVNTATLPALRLRARPGRATGHCVLHWLLPPTLQQPKKWPDGDFRGSP